LRQQALEVFYSVDEARLSRGILIGPSSDSPNLIPKQVIEVKARHAYMELAEAVAAQ